MGRPKADLAAYSPWGAVTIPPPAPPTPAWLPVIPAAGVQTWSDLAMWALTLPGVNPKVSLFTNFYQPTQQSVLTDFTAPTAPGLAARALPAAIRGGTNPCARATWTWPVVTFTAGGGGLPVMIWGYYVYCTDPLTNVTALLWAQRLVTAFAFTVAGDALPIPLAVSFGQC